MFFGSGDLDGRTMPEEGLEYGMIRLICADELPMCLEVIHRSFATIAVEFGLTAENCPTNGAFMPLSRLEADYTEGNAMWGVFAEEGQVGFCQVGKLRDGCVELEKLAVLPEYRHRGYGAEMLAAARQRAAECGAAYLTIGIIEENTRLKVWYTVNGFMHMGTRRFPHLPFTVGFMRLPLDSKL